MSGFESYSAASRRNWGNSDDRFNIDQLNLGCLQRIADAVELMAQNYQQLVADRDSWKRRAEQSDACAERVVRSNRALRGVITRMKGK